MITKIPLKILSLSQYGSGMSDPDNQFSGALDRQKDYSQYVTRFDIVVPSSTGSDKTFSVNENLDIHPLVVKGIISFYFHAYRKAVELQKKEQYDVIMVDNPHLMGVLGVVLKWRLGTTLLVHSMADMIHNKWYRIERLSNYIKDICIRFMLLCTDFVRVSTEYELQRLQTVNAKSNKIHRVSFYIDGESFAQQLTDKKSTGKQLLFVGRLGPQKDLEVLMRAMEDIVETHPDAHLTIVGDGPKRAQLEQQAKDLRIDSKVTFTGSIPYSEVAQYFSQSDVFVITSLYEGTCMVLHEAALASLPIVSTDFAGAHDFVREGQEGYLVPIRDHVLFAKKVSELLSSPEDIERMGTNAKNRVSNFSREYALAQWQTLCTVLQKET